MLRPQPMRWLSHAACQKAVVRLRGSAARMSARRMRPNSAHAARRGPAVLHSLHSMLAAGPCKGSCERHTRATSTLLVSHRPGGSPTAFRCTYVPRPCRPCGHASYKLVQPSPRLLPHPLAAHPRPKCWPEKANARNAWTLRHHCIATVLQEQDLMENCNTSGRAWAWAARERQSGARPVAQAAAKRLAGASCLPAAFAKARTSGCCLTGSATFRVHAPRHQRPA